MKPPPLPEGSPLENKRATTRRKFATEVYKPSNRLLPPNKRLWASENVNDLSEDTAPSKEIQQVIEQAPPKRVKLKVVEESESKVRPKAGRKVANKPVKLSDKSNAQKEVARTSGRVTRSSAMTNSRVGRSKIDVLADQEEEIPAKAVKLAGPPRMGRGEDADEVEVQEDNFLDVSADHRISFRRTKPTQQSLGADVTLTFDMDRHSRALAGCSPIPRIPHHQLGDQLEAEAPSAAEDLEPPPPSTSVVKKTRAKLKIPSQTPAAEPVPSPPKKRTRRQPTTKSSKTKASKGPGSDDPLMI